MKTAIITGINGQDGSYLAELLLNKHYNVIGIKRRSSTNTYDRIKHLLNNEFFHVIEGDICDFPFITKLIHETQADEFYNLAAMSHVKSSFDQPVHTFRVNCEAVINMLESIRNFSKNTKFYQASTSEMFGNNRTAISMFNNEIEYIDLIRAKKDLYKNIQNEDTPLDPRSPYAVAKVAAHNAVKLYREAYGIFACAGVLFNHEGPRRGENFVTRKITKWIGEFGRYDEEYGYGLNHNLEDKDNIVLDTGHTFPKLRLGNLDSFRDWGHSRDYCDAMYLMLQQQNPDDYVICTGETHSIRDFLRVAFKCIGIDNWEEYVVQDPKFMRPCEVDYLCGDCTKAQTTLGWKPTTTFEDLVKEMVAADYNV